jgi:hypothetical protein
VIARNDDSTDVEELGVSHELTPSRREHNCGDIKD